MNWLEFGAAFLSALLCIVAVSVVILIDLHIKSENESLGQLVTRLTLSTIVLALLIIVATVIGLNV